MVTKKINFVTLNINFVTFKKIFMKNFSLRLSLITGIWILLFGTLHAQEEGLRRLYDADLYFYPQGRIYTSFRPLDAERLDTARLHQYYRNLKIPAQNRFWNYVLNKDFLKAEGDGYSLRLMPVFYLEAGRSGDTDLPVFINTRGVQIDGEIGKHLAFSTAVYENQARFPAYLDTLFVLRQAANGFPGSVPGFGIAKNRENGILDYPSVRGHVRYDAGRFFDLEIGHDAFFIGEGKRSLLLDDKVPPYAYAQIITSVWHVRYVVMWSMLQDINISGTKYYHRKYMALHYLDWAINEKFNLGLFESVIWDPDEGRGFDLNFLNPVIFYKTIEFQSGTKGGNTLLGLHFSYRPVHQLMFYSQFLLDEMTVSKFFGDPGYWGNKFGIQAGVKGYYSYRDHLFFGRLEYNRVRPYTYSHHPSVTNYAHDNYSLGHPWGANLSEWILQLKWNYKRLKAVTEWTTGLQGADYPGIPETYGADFLRDYEDRIASEDVYLLQGNLFQRRYWDTEVSYLVNPAWKWEIYSGLTAVRHKVEEENGFYQNRNFVWFRIGMRANMPFYTRDW